MVNNYDAESGIKKNPIEYDPTLLAELAQRAIGTRSIAEFCAETNLSKSFISRLLNQKLSNAPKPSTLYRFASNTNPQNGVTLGDMLVASGYKASEMDFIKSDNDAAEKECLTLAKSIQLYYSESPAFGLNLFLNVLIAKGYGEAYSIDFSPQKFSLKIKNDKGMDTTIVGIPAFCKEDSAITAIQLATLTTLFSSVNSYPVSETLFFIMTDSSKLYELLLNSLPVLQDMKLAILLTNEKYNGFSRQNTIVSKKENDVFDIGAKEFSLLLSD